MSLTNTDSTDSEMTVAEKLKGHPYLVLIGCFLILLGLGWLDFATGYELSFFIFYSVPIGFAAWYSGQWPAIMVALGATAAWLLADYFGGVKYSTNYIYYWNTTIHFGAFIINAVTIAKIKLDLDRRHVLAKELKITQAKLEALSARLPTCPACGHSFETASEPDNPKSSAATD